MSVASVAVLGGLVAAAKGAPAQDLAPDQASRTLVIQVDGLLDPPNADLVDDALTRAADGGAGLVVLQLSSPGAVAVDVDALVEKVVSSPVPVAVWIGPSGASVRGAALLLAEAADVVVMAPGTSIGPAVPVSLDHPGRVDVAEAEADLEALATSRGRSPAAALVLAGERLDSDQARQSGVADRLAPTVGELIVSLDGQIVFRDGRPERVVTARVVGQGEDARRAPVAEVRFEELSLSGQLRHVLTSPSIAYLLFVVGLLLIVFEFFTAGIGLAGGAGALALVGAIVGFGSLPVAPWAVALLVLGVLGFSVDVQAGSLGAWTYIGGAALIAGSIFLYDGSSQLDPAWWVLAAVVGGAVVFMLAAMTAVVRARFSTPTVGREGMVGELGVAEVEIAPDGVARVREALWRARTNRATPIPAGATVRVVSVEGTSLEVEPEEGGARDYRDRARERGDGER